MEEATEIRVFQCMSCRFRAPCFARMLRHYSAVHEHEIGFQVTCSFDACQKKFKNVRSFKRHLKGKHDHFYSAYVKNECTNPNAEETVHHNDEDNIDNDGPPNVHDLEACQNNDIQREKDIRSLIALQLLRLREARKLTYVSCSHALDAMANVVSAKDNLLQTAFQGIIQAENVNPATGQKLQEAMSQNIQAFQAVVDEFSDERKLNTYVQENFCFVEPEEHFVGNETQHSLQYVPILQSLRYLLMHEDIFAQVITSHKSEDGLLRDICDGAYFQRNLLFANDPHALQIMLYYDEFTSVNPIGHAAKDFKFGAFYFLLGNLAPQYRSKLHVIQLALLANAKTVKKHGFSAVIIPLLRDLKTLEDEGILVQISGRNHRFRGSVTVVVADNLGSHSIGGFQESFNCLRNCRFCMVTREQLRRSHSIDNCERRTVASHNEHVQRISEFPNMAGIYGVKAASRLNELQYFHVINGLPSDIAHDLFEGVVCDALEHVITSFVQDKIFSLNDLEQIMKEFPYKGTDKVNKPRPLSTHLAQLKVKQKAVQIWCLLRLFPLMIGHLIPEGNPKWEMILALCDVVDTVTAPCISRGEALHLSDSVQKFHTHLANEFPDVTVKPKGHYILHYPHQILEFGPLIAYWTLRFEGKHSFFKEIAQRLKCRKNVCKSLAFRHQYHQALCHESESFLEYNSVSHMKNTQTVQVELLLQDVQALLHPLVGENKCVCQCSSAHLNGMDYQSGCCVVVSFENDELKFAKVMSCFLIGGTLHLLCKEMKTQSFNRHSHCYVVQELQSYSLIKTQELLDYYPLPIYQLGEQNVVVLHHKVSYDF